jgi:hypothetical protein
MHSKIYPPVNLGGYFTSGFSPMFALILISLLSLVAESYAEDNIISTSPDGRYDVVVTSQADQPDIPFALIRDKKTRKKFDTDAHGYDGHS